MKRFIAFVFLVLFLWGCASVPVMPQTEVGPIEGNFVQTGLGASPGIIFEEITQDYSPFPSFDMYSSTRLRILGPYDARFTAGITLPFGLYISFGSSGQIYKYKFLSLNYSVDVGYSGVSNYTYGSEGDTLNKISLTSYSFIFCPNLEFNPVESNIFRLRIYGGPYTSFVKTFVSNYDFSTASSSEDENLYFIGGVHLSGMVQIFRILSVVIGFNPPLSIPLGIGNVPFSSPDISFYVAPYIFLSLGF